MRKKKNNSITTGSLIFSVEFNPHGPNVSEIINTDKHSLETDKKIETIISKNIYILFLQIKEEETCKNFSLESTHTTSKVIC